MGCLSPQMGPAGGGPPPRAAVTPSPFSLPAAFPLPPFPACLSVSVQCGHTESVLVGVPDMGGPPR